MKATFWSIELFYKFESTTFLMLFILVFILPLAITSIQVWNESIQINYALWIVKAGAGGNG